MRYMLQQTTAYFDIATEYTVDHLIPFGEKRCVLNLKH